MDVPNYLGIAQGGAEALNPLQTLLSEAGIDSQVAMPPGANPNS